MHLCGSAPQYKDEQEIIRERRTKRRTWIRQTWLCVSVKRRPQSTLAPFEHSCIWLFLFWNLEEINISCEERSWVTVSGRDLHWGNSLSVMWMGLNKQKLKLSNNWWKPTRVIYIRCKRPSNLLRNMDGHNLKKVKTFVNTVHNLSYIWLTRT